MNESAYHELHEINTDLETLRTRLEACEHAESLWVGSAVQEIGSALAMLAQALGE